MVVDDRPRLLGAVVALMLAGVVLSLAASPAVAERLGFDSFYFVKRHALFLVPALVLMLGDLVPDAAPGAARRARRARRRRSC